jgi:hypothetical protein
MTRAELKREEHLALSGPEDVLKIRKEGTEYVTYLPFRHHDRRVAIKIVDG